MFEVAISFLMSAAAESMFAWNEWSVDVFVFTAKFVAAIRHVEATDNVL